MALTSCSFKAAVLAAIGALSVLAFAGDADAAEVKVAVAANFTEPVKEIAAAFEKSSGHKVVPSFGATGQFYAQITQGAPFEILVAADQANALDLGALFEHLRRAFDLQVFDQDDRITVGQDGAV